MKINVLYIMLEIAKKITKKNWVVTLYQKWNGEVDKTERCGPIVNMFMERIGSDCILYDYQTDIVNGKRWLYAIFAEIKEDHSLYYSQFLKHGGGLWICRTDDVDALSIKYASDDFGCKKISDDSCYETFFKWIISNKTTEVDKDHLEFINIDWDNIKDISTDADRMRFLEK